VIYLATHNRHPEFRFVTIADVGGTAADWALSHPRADR